LSVHKQISYTILITFLQMGIPLCGACHRPIEKHVDVVTAHGKQSRVKIKKVILKLMIILKCQKCSQFNYKLVFLEFFLNVLVIKKMFLFYINPSFLQLSVCKVCGR
jgi:hypothetical protein